MWRSPAFFQEFLNQQGLVGNLYDAIQKDDLADAVIVALDILKKTNNIPPLVKQRKCKSKSTTHRQQGNKDYRDGKYQKALENYNKAMGYAPKGSDELVLAYSNRSALLATCKMFQACLNDISTCNVLGCPAKIRDKLAKRREEAMKGLWMEQMAKEIRYSSFADDYLLFDERRNPQIHCASTDIGVIMEGKIPKVVATRDVKVGKVIAMEKAFVTLVDCKSKYRACHYCNKINLNLIPCEGCCSAMFCDKDCLNDCLEEYHSIECSIMEIFSDLAENSVLNLDVNAAIKLKNQFESWEEFNEATTSLGLKRMKTSEINDIFDGDNKYSLLNFKDDAPFQYGSIYNATFGCAVVMHYLGNMTSFLPSRGPDKVAAVRGFARLLMYYSYNRSHTQIMSTVSVMDHGSVEFCDNANFGFLSFTGKLKKACNPNVLVLGLNDEVALIALQPLKPGMELTIAPLGHWLDNAMDRNQRLRNLFIFHGTACSCPICNGDWKLLLANAKPTETHLRCLRKLDVSTAMANFDSMEIETVYPKCCKILAFLSDIPFSNEYTDVYKLFRKCLLVIRDQYTANYMLNSNSSDD